MADAGEKARKLREMTTRVENLRREEETAKKSLHDLKQLKSLSEKMGRHNLTLHRLDSFIEQRIRS